MKISQTMGLMSLIMWSQFVMAQQDTVRAKTDTINIKKGLRDTLALAAKPSLKPVMGYQIDTSFEAINLERYYYGLDGREASYDFNPWDDYLFQEGEGREDQEREQRDQERDSRE